jgi:hypothetical protein
MPLGRTHADWQGRLGVTRYECSACGGLHRSAASAEACCSYTCSECGSLHMYSEDADECCSTSWQCPECGSVHESEEGVEECCSEIREQRELMRKEKANRYKYPADLLRMQPQYVISIPAIEGRPARTISVEQEMSDGARRVAKMMYDMQASPLSDITNYRADCNPGEVIVKEDGSLDRTVGGEALYSRFRLDDPTQSLRFSKVIWCIRQLRNLGLVKTSRNAGTHIHIGAVPAGRDMYSPTSQVFGPAQMAALYEIFTFCEDVLFRLAAAGWASHRGTRYTQLFPKESGMNAGKLAKTAQRSRHFSLNFQRLLNAVRQCTCSACVTGDWQECECGALAAGTIEWRVFNATTKPETMHAWILLASALTAKAFDYQLGDLQPNGYQDTELGKHAWILGWILNNCPLLPSERAVILSLAKRAPGLEVDWRALEESLDLPRLTDESDDETIQVAPEGIVLV